MKKNDRTYWERWYPRKDCTNKADYKKKTDEKEANSTTENNYFKDFKVVLVVIYSDNDCKVLKSQFFRQAEK